MVLTRSARRAPGSLIAMPPDALLLIMRLCGPAAVLQLRLTASALKALAEDAALWAEFAAALVHGCPLAITDASEGGHASWRAYPRLALAARLRFDSRLPEHVPVLEIASFGTVGACSLDVSEPDGLAVSGGFMDAVRARDRSPYLVPPLTKHIHTPTPTHDQSSRHIMHTPQRAEIELPHALGDLRMIVEMPEANGFSHFVYTRRAHNYLVWEASARGTYSLEVRGGGCVVTRPPSTLELEYAESLAPFGVRLALPSGAAATHSAALSNGTGTAAESTVSTALDAVTTVPPESPLVFGVHLYHRPACASITRLELLA